jgi:energy-coupling factor transporter transmembrane protein EcfT
MCGCIEWAKKQVKRLNLWDLADIKVYCFLGGMILGAFIPGFVREYIWVFIVLIVALVAKLMLKIFVKK